MECTVAAWLSSNRQQQRTCCIARLRGGGGAQNAQRGVHAEAHCGLCQECYLKTAKRGKQSMTVMPGLQRQGQLIPGNPSPEVRGMQAHACAAAAAAAAAQHHCLYWTNHCHCTESLLTLHRITAYAA
eukprot:scaffold10715_cov25-Tisochrysis_lutea.AAC.3